MKILITGATGKLGGLVVDELLKKTEAANIAVMLRDDKSSGNFADRGIDVRIGSYDDTDTMIKAFNGIDQLYFVSGPDLEARLIQHKKVIAAAIEAKVGHIVYTSFSRKGGPEPHPLYTLAEGHLIAENAIKDSGITYTILLNNYYMEVIPMFAGEDLLQTKTLYFPAGHGKSGFIAREDIAELSAKILVSPGHKNKIYEVSGEQAYDFEEVAKLISEVTSTRINYVSPSEKEFEMTLENFGIPPETVELVVLSAKAIIENEFNKTSETFRNITGRPPITLHDFLKKQYDEKLAKDGGHHTPISNGGLEVKNII